MTSALKIIQTLHIADSNSNSLSARHNFLSAEFNWMSWALSCLQLKKLYGEVELFTNKKGKEILIDRFELPYSKVHVVLDNFNIPRNLLFLPKICTYSLQNEPFLHVDGDLFMWERLDNEILNSELIAQNLEESTEYYREIYQLIADKNIWIPQCIQQELALPLIKMYNCGIVGGQDVEFFKDLVKESIQILEKNEPMLPELTSHPWGFNFVYEQHLFYCLSKSYRKNVRCIFPEEVCGLQYDHLGNFLDVPHQSKYVHLLGVLKGKQQSCLRLAKRLRQDYPEYYYRIINEFKKDKVPLYLRYYGHGDDNVDNKNHSYGSDFQTDWNVLYDLEKIQHNLLEKAFANAETLASFTFKVNDLNSPIKTNLENQSGTLNIPVSLLKTYATVQIDELDYILSDILKKPQFFENLFVQIKSLFDEDELLDGDEELKELITLRIKLGCETGLFIIETT